MLEIRYIQCLTSIHAQKLTKGSAVCETSLMKLMCCQKRHNSPTKCSFSQISGRNAHQEPLWKTTQLLWTSDHALFQSKLSTLSGLPYLKKLCQFKMHSSAPKRLLSQMSRRNADYKLEWKTSQLQCLTSIHAHKFTKLSVLWELQLFKKKMPFETADFPTKYHFSQMSRRNATNFLTLRNL